MNTNKSISLRMVTYNVYVIIQYRHMMDGI